MFFFKNFSFSLTFIFFNTPHVPLYLLNRRVVGGLLEVVDDEWRLARELVASGFVPYFFLDSSFCGWLAGCR